MDCLMRPNEPQILLHGDLHHWNVLRDAANGWMAIDPKGVIGASCLDVGRFIGNAMGFSESVAESRQILLDAIRVFSDALGESEERMFAGAFCDRVTGCSWGAQVRGIRRRSDGAGDPGHDGRDRPRHRRCEVVTEALNAPTTSALID